MLHADQPIEHRHIIAEFLRMYRHKVSNRRFLMIVKTNVWSEYFRQSRPIKVSFATERNWQYPVAIPLHHMFDKFGYSSEPRCNNWFLCQFEIPSSDNTALTMTLPTVSSRVGSDLAALRVLKVGAIKPRAVREGK